MYWCLIYVVIPTEAMAVRKRLSMVVTVGVAELFDGHFAQVSPEDFSCLQGSGVSGVTSAGKRNTADLGQWQSGHELDTS
jgi:hypothetical protein